MNKEFIPYEQALALKELGFDEPCFGQYLSSRQSDWKIYELILEMGMNEEFEDKPEDIKDIKDESSIPEVEEIPEVIEKDNLDNDSTDFEDDFLNEKEDKKVSGDTLGIFG